MNWLKKLICKECVILKEENKALRDMIVQKENEILRKQEHINQTNAYWKKKMHEAKPSKTKKKDL
jgi:hypothetical protein